MMRQRFEKELQAFDRERVIPAWDRLIAKQQAALEALGVPAMFVTDNGSDREVCCTHQGEHFNLIYHLSDNKE